MEAELGRGVGGRLLKECKEAKCVRDEVTDEAAQKTLWAFSEKQIEGLEREGAVRRALAKKEAEKAAEGGATTDKDVKEEKEGKENKPESRRSRKAAK